MLKATRTLFVGAVMLAVAIPGQAGVAAEIGGVCNTPTSEYHGGAVYPFLPTSEVSSQAWSLPSEAGTVTSWTVKRDQPGDGQARLLLLRQSKVPGTDLPFPGKYDVVAVSNLEATTQGTNAFATSLPVQKIDGLFSIGLYAQPKHYYCADAHLWNITEFWPYSGGPGPPYTEDPPLGEELVAGTPTWSAHLSLSVHFDPAPGGGGGDGGAPDSRWTNKTPRVQNANSVVRKKALTLRVDTTEAAALIEAHGTVNIPNVRARSAKTYKLKPVELYGVDPGEHKLKLKLSKRAAKALTKAARKGKTAKAKTIIVVTSNDGDETTFKDTITLKPRKRGSRNRKV